MHLINNSIAVIICFLGATTFGSGQPAEHLKSNAKIHFPIPEPSDITLSSDNKNYLVVSDHGILFRMGLNGEVISKAKTEGGDFEGICNWNNKIYVSEESFRKIMVYDELTLDFLYSVPVQYNGGRNQGFESIARNESKNCFILISEKNPCIIFEADSTFNMVREFASPVSEISSACWHNGYVYVLSDELHQVFQLDPLNYKILNSYDVPVTNPEGITFNNSGNLLILSDDRAMLFTFNPIEK